MAFCDFVVKYDPKTEPPIELTKRILYSIIIKPIKAKKPRVIFIGGDSGEGKSFTVLRLQEILLEIQGLKLEDYIKNINVITPIEYPQKLDALLFNKEYKKVNIIGMHEAREVIKAKLWHGFLAQAIGDINAMSRTVKRLCIMIVSQFIRDITTDVRYTLHLYCKIRRPVGKRARLYINVMWKDDRDLEKPKLRKRKLSGYIVDPKGRYRRYVPQYFEMSKPRKENVQVFEKMDYDAKAAILRGKINKLIKEMKDEIGEKTKKVDVMVDWYIQHPDSIPKIGRQVRGKLKLRPQFREMHELTPSEARDFQNKINERLKEMGAIADDNKVREEAEEDKVFSQA